MGKIKSKAVKKAGKDLIEGGIEFNENFEYNKKILGKRMPSKKVRNQIAGYLARIIKREKRKKQEIEKQIKNN